MIPADALLLANMPGSNDPDFETNLARFAWQVTGGSIFLPGQPPSGMILVSRVREGVGRWCSLSMPLALWDLTSQRITLIRGWVLIDRNASGRRDVWTGDDPAVLLRMFTVKTPAKKRAC
jgi:hypothetical protein